MILIAFDETVLDIYFVVEKEFDKANFNWEAFRFIFVIEIISLNTAVRIIDNALNNEIFLFSSNFKIRIEILWICFPQMVMYQ